MTFLHSATTVTKIADSKKNLSQTTIAKKNTSRQLEKIAQDIQSAEKDIVALEQKISELEKEQKNFEKEYGVLKKELQNSEEDLIQTNQILGQKHKRFISLLSEQFSIVFAMEKAHEATRESILLEEVYRAYQKQNAKMLGTMREDIAKLKKQKEDKTYLRNKTKNNIDTIVKKREEYERQKSKKEQLRKTLAKDEEKYNERLTKIVDRQNSLRTTLAQLNVLHAKEVQVAQKRAEAEKEAMRMEKQRQREAREAQSLARAKARKAEDALKNAQTEPEREKARLAVDEAKKEQQEAYKESERVRQVNSSYQQSSTYAYRGSKTISPLFGAKITKKFGTYMDPIYKIKIFNESITLKAPVANAKVKNVLNGKVVFAGKSSMLGNVVVVSHNDRIHTVYAGLSKIAPTIHTGTKIQKGYVVGKVNEKLIFQATKDSRHIDPLKLIQI
ncbi:MAG: hypothetical protein RL113_197 [Pseudomonadota bacterium]